MTSIIKKAIPLAASLLVLAGSPAFAATHHLAETHSDDLITSTDVRQLPPLQSPSDDSSPYIGQWVEGRPGSDA
jgi:hypothetical protein